MMRRNNNWPWSGVLLLLLVFVPGLPQTTPEQPIFRRPELKATIAQHLQSATQKLRAGRFIEARAEFQYCLVLDPQNPQIHYLLALTYPAQANKSELQLVDYHMTAAYQGGYRKRESLLNRAKARMQLADYRGVIDDLQVLLEEEPENADFSHELGTAYFRLGDWEKAIQNYRKAIDGKSQDLVARWNLTLASRLQGSEVPPQYKFVYPDGSEKNPIRFREVATSVGIVNYSRGRGSAWGDVDGDGDLDLISVGIRDRHSLFINIGHGKFRDETVTRGLDDFRGGWGSLFLDYDNDGDLDLYIVDHGPNSLYRNNGRGWFTKVSDQSGVVGTGLGSTVTVCDYDLDGDLDLYVANEFVSPNELFRNNGDGTFTEVGRKAGVANAGQSVGCACGDYDNDGNPDLVVANVRGRSALYRNRGDGTFENVTRKAGIHMPEMAFMTFFFDYNNDGWLDIFVSGYTERMEKVLESVLKGQTVDSAAPLALFRNDADGTFTNVTESARLTGNYGAMGANFGDIDNDGFLDIYLGNGGPPLDRFEPNTLLRNNGDGTFSDITQASGTGNLGKGHGITLADFDEDGDLDLFVPTGGALVADRQPDALYLNEGNSNHWFILELRQPEQNRFAVGAKVKLEVAGSMRYAEVSGGHGFGSLNSYPLEFGLGKATVVKKITITWPGGEQQTLENLPADQYLIVTRGGGTQIKYASP